MGIVRFGTYLKDRFGMRVQRVSLHAGMTCPNRDGTIGTGGCIYCDNGSFHPYDSTEKTITEQMTEGMNRAKKRYGASLFLAYFQTFTNTYANTDTLRRLYDEALSFPEVVGLMIATRPDCLQRDIIDLIQEYARHTMVWVEVGVQTIHDRTLKMICRGHTFRQTQQAFDALEEASVHAVAHVILGLPGETRDHMMQTADWLNATKVKAVKLHHLHAVKNTELARLYSDGAWSPMAVESYIDTAAEFLYRLPDGVIVMRLVSDCPDKLLVVPRWPLKKQEIELAVLRRLEELTAINRRRWHHDTE